MNQYFPFLDWIKNYKRENFKGDLFAGITVGVMLIPQGMAYAMLAGLPPIYGLYAATIPLIIYALLGTSRQLAVGPAAMVSLLIASGIGTLATAGTEQFVALAILLAFMVGVIQFSMGFFRLGFLVNFLSHPVITGFTSAAAIIIGLSQLKHLLGFSIPKGHAHETLLYVIEHIGHTNLPTFGIGLGAILLLFLIKKTYKQIPGPLILVILGIAVVWFFQLSEQGVAIVKDVPGGLPALSIPVLNLSHIQSLLPIALTISFVGFIESIAVAKAVQAKHKDYKISANQELMALGLANIGGSFFSSFPVTGGFSRTAVNDQAGAKTGMASIISAVLILFTLLLLTKYFYYLPNAILAAIIMVAVIGLIDVEEAKHLWHTDRTDFWLFIITAISTLVLGIEEGILIGITLSLGMMIYKVSYPHIAELGQIKETAYFRNVKRFDNLVNRPNLLILRLDAPLFFANANYVRDKIENHLRQNPNIKDVVISGQSINSIDSTALHVCQDMVNDAKGKGVHFYFTGLIGPVRDSLYKAQLFDQIGEERFFMRVNDAVAHIENKTNKDEQTNIKELVLQSD